MLVQSDREAISQPERQRFDTQLLTDANKDQRCSYDMVMCYGTDEENEVCNSHCHRLLSSHISWLFKNSDLGLKWRHLVGLLMLQRKRVDGRINRVGPRRFGGRKIIV